MSHFSDEEMNLSIFGYEFTVFYTLDDRDKEVRLDGLMLGSFRDFDDDENILPLISKAYYSDILNEVQSKQF